MICIDLDHAGQLFNRWPLTSIDKPGLGWFKRSDYAGPSAIPVKQHILDQVEQKYGFRPQGKVTLLTHLRMWGILMNPIAVFCCYHKDGGLAAMVLQVTNTPWGEQCLYVLKTDSRSHKQSFEFDKAMHVSPFNPMDMRYSCRYLNRRDKLLLHLENHREKKCVTDATLVMNGRPLTRRQLYQSVLLYPYMTAKVYYAIYRQALALFIKRNPLYTNPKTINQVEARQPRGPVLK